MNPQPDSGLQPLHHPSCPFCPPTVLISLLCLGSSAQNRVEVLAGDLRFSKLSLEDSGMYQCVAENKHGTIYASAELAVQGKGVILGPAGCAGWCEPLLLQTHACMYTSEHTHTLSIGFSVASE